MIQQSMDSQDKKEIYIYFLLFGQFNTSILLIQIYGVYMIFINMLIVFN